MDGRVASLRLLVQERILNVVCTYASYSSSEYPHFFESLEEILASSPTGRLVGTWDKNTQSMIDFVVVSSDLRLYVLETQVKRGPERSTDHHLV